MIRLAVCDDSPEFLQRISRMVENGRNKVKLRWSYTVF